MTLCPIAMVATCQKCPAFSVCPLKTTLGDYRPDEDGDSGKAQASAKRD